MIKTTEHQVDNTLSTDSRAYQELKGMIARESERLQADCINALSLENIEGLETALIDQIQWRGEKMAALVKKIIAREIV